MQQTRWSTMSVSTSHILPSEILIKYRITIVLRNYSLTCVRQRAGHFIRHSKHWLHLLLFNVHVLLCLLTVIALTWQTNSHFPHNVHLWISFPMRHRDLCDDLKNSENKCIPNSRPIEEWPIPCLPLISHASFLGIPNYIENII